MKYVVRGTVILPARRSSAASLSSEKRFPVAMQKAKLFLEWTAANFANAVSN